MGKTSRGHQELYVWLATYVLLPGVAIEFGRLSDICRLETA